MTNTGQNSNWHAEETYRSLIQISLGGLRFAIFANGGAAVALLAFLGKESIAALSLGSVRCSMTLFITGVALGGFAHVTAYLTQLRLYGESAHGKPHAGPLRHGVLLYLTIALVAASIVTFAIGAWLGVAAIHPAIP